MNEIPRSEKRIARFPKLEKFLRNGLKPLVAAAVVSILVGVGAKPYERIVTARNICAKIGATPIYTPAQSVLFTLYSVIDSSIDSTNVNLFIQNPNSRYLSIFLNSTIQQIQYGSLERMKDILISKSNIGYSEDVINQQEIINEIETIFVERDFDNFYQRLKTMKGRHYLQLDSIVQRVNAQARGELNMKSPLYAELMNERIELQRYLCGSAF